MWGEVFVIYPHILIVRWNPSCVRRGYWFVECTKLHRLREGVFKGAMHGSYRGRGDWRWVWRISRADVKGSGSPTTTRQERLKVMITSIEDCNDSLIKICQECISFRHSIDDKLLPCETLQYLINHYFNTARIKMSHILKYSDQSKAHMISPDLAAPC